MQLRCNLSDALMQHHDETEGLFFRKVFNTKGKRQLKTTKEGRPCSSTAQSQRLRLVKQGHLGIYLWTIFQ